LENRLEIRVPRYGHTRKSTAIEGIFESVNGNCQMDGMKNNGKN
jgi:hypothetical protein